MFVISSMPSLPMHVLVALFLVAASPFVASFGGSGDGQSVFIVHLTGDYPPAVAYEGGIRGFAATAPKAATSAAGIRFGHRPRLDSQATHVRVYVSFLRQLHRDIARSVGLAHADVLYRYGKALVFR